MTRLHVLGSGSAGNAFAVPLGEFVGFGGPIGGTEIEVKHAFGATGGGWTFATGRALCTSIFRGRVPPRPT